MIAPVRIDTPRLTIRSFRPSDIPDYAEVVADARVTRYLGDGHPHTFDQAAEYIETTMAEERATGVARLAVEEKASGRFIGFCGFRSLADYTDFGWRYAYEAWGRGFGSEAAGAVLSYGIDTLGLTNLAAQSYVENEASLRIIRKLGFPRHEHLEINGMETIRYYQSDTTRP